MLDAAAVERFKAGYLRQFGAVTGDPLLEAVAAGRAFPGMEHWLPLFHPDLVPLTAYLDAEAEIGLDHLALDAIKARAALIGEHYEARLQPPVAGTSFGAAPYRRAAAASCSISTRAASSARWPAARRLQFSTFGPPPRPPAGIAAVEDLGGRPARDFARRARRPLGQPVRRHRRASARSWSAAGERPLLAAYSEGTAERLRQVLADHGFDALTRVERWAEVAEVAVAAHRRPAAGARLHRARHPRPGRARSAGRPADRGRQARRARPADKFIQDIAALARGRPRGPCRARHRPLRGPGDAARSAARRTTA